MMRFPDPPAWGMLAGSVGKGIVFAAIAFGKQMHMGVDPARHLVFDARGSAGFTRAARHRARDRARDRAWGRAAFATRRLQSGAAHRLRLGRRRQRRE